MSLKAPKAVKKLERYDILDGEGFQGESFVCSRASVSLRFGDPKLTEAREQAVSSHEPTTLLRCSPSQLVRRS